jgi:hypothetical protein
MGSLSYAVGGGLAGLGQGLQKVGEENWADLRDAAHERLRADLEARNRQAEQESAQTFQRGQQQAEFGQQEHMAQVGATSAMARLKQAQDFQGALKKLEIEGRHKDIADLIAGRITVQDLRNQGNIDTAGVRKGPQSEYKPGKATLNSPGLDVFKKPIPGKAVDVQIHHDGSKWIQGPGGELYPFDPSQPTGYVDPKSLSRPGAQDQQALLQNPLGTLPSGVSIRDYFVKRFGRLPVGYLGAANTARAQMSRSQSQTGTPGVNNTSYNPNDDRDADEDTRASGVLDPYGQNGPPTSQPSDDQPAQ